MMHPVFEITSEEKLQANSKYNRNLRFFWA